VSPAAAEPARQRRPRFYVFRVLHKGDPPVVSALPGSFTDLINAWQEAGCLRAEQPQAIFIAGELSSTQ